MKCPYCLKDHSESVVFETRKFEGNIYRRRFCKACGLSFVSQESATLGLKMPNYRRVKNITNDGALTGPSTNP